MTKSSFLLGGLLGLIFVGGFVAILVTGRPKPPAPEPVPEVPVMVITEEVPITDAGETPSEETSDSLSTPTPEPTPTPAPAPTPDPTVFTFAQVQQHASESDCWTAVNGSVYDLTSWIGRHPGGPGPILGLCGRDGGAMFAAKHGSSSRPNAMLVLLKIGTLAQ